MIFKLSRNMELELREHIDKVVSETPSTWREEAEDRDRYKELHDKIADTELQLECCRDALQHLKKKIVKLEEQLKKQSYCIICGQTLNQEET